MPSPLQARTGLAAALTLCATLCAPVFAQTHKVGKPQNVVRAVAVYEWTGDMAKPSAMRLIPVTVFIDDHLQDAGVYLARPVPFALETGTQYEVQEAGVPKGLIDLRFSRHFDSATTSDSPYDDGWFGYGRFAQPAPPKKSSLHPSTTLAKINGLDDEDDSQPHFSARSAAPGSGGAAAGVPSASDTSPANDPDRPTLHRGSNSGSTQSAGTAGSNPPPDPDRPTLHRGSSGSSDGADIADPDQPTLRRRPPADAHAATASDGIADVPALNNDPNRPLLHRGKPAAEITEADLPKLSGLPGEKELHQMVAVSDAANRPVHNFARPWDDDASRLAALAGMQSFAQAQLAAYETANHQQPAPAPSDARHPNSKLRHGVTPDTKPVPPPSESLQDEVLKAYSLTYGGPAVYVYTAHTEGLGPTLHYITLVAEMDMHGNPQLALTSVTDAAHLDRTPRLRLIDAVDVEANNRGSLLFELRETNARQFALYTVLGGHAQQYFITGTTQ
jgi:hypothetical protein